jgi:hypothetical protein
MALVDIGLSHIDMRNLVLPVGCLNCSFDPYCRVVLHVARARMAPRPVSPKILVFSFPLSLQSFSAAVDAGTHQISIVRKLLKSELIAAVSQARRIAAAFVPSRGWAPVRQVTAGGI